jgi:DNA-binding MarR family transcriptional regulator
MSDSSNPLADLTPEELRAAGDAGDAVRCFRLILYLGQRLRYLADRRLRGEGLTSQQGFLLTVVRMRGRPTLGEVAAAMSTTHQNVKQIAVALERKGMVRFVADEDDARVRRLAPTEAGERGWEDRNAGDFAAIADWFAGLSAGEQRQMAGLLGRLAGSIGETR